MILAAEYLEIISSILGIRQNGFEIRFGFGVLTKNNRTSDAYHEKGLKCNDKYHAESISDLNQSCCVKDASPAGTVTVEK